MLRKMFATTAIAALMTAPVMAQDATEQDKAKEMEASSTTTMEASSDSMSSDINEEDMLASTFIGKTVYTSTNDDAEAIGDVEDVVLDKSGKVDAVVVSVGGFLGIGDKSVALPFDRLSMEMKDGEQWIVSDATSEELNQMAEFDADMLAPEQPEAAMTEAEGEAAEGAEEAEPMAEEAGQETEQAAETAAMETEQAAETAATETEQAADATANEAEQETEEAAAEVEQEGEQMAEQGQDATVPVVPADGEPAATEQQAMAEQPSLRESMQPADMESVSVEQLIGTTVYGQSEENLGEIGDVILGDDKSIEAYIIDVGGFLGIGEKPVAISPDAIELMKQAESDDYAIFTKFTEEQLDQQAEYSQEEYEANPDSVVLK
ncbi:hypothetical protein B7H23_09930 [Notoacmeibacter marinus]|uniref:PRC-barrel domain-containing protein n=1 Tax=Notoacmeibacter marinus TaxID=1876515 RepID=A0A231UWW0_9HYPH|nr:PRC-barrel domain-containing protein [Notoacmeibacter marinus]OXT00439.1 hypothetical protein B7H23_09930 [Notoacmeibacter marinus]